jgi:hypothetical protein
MELDVLFFPNGLELDGFIGILPSARWAAAVEVFFDMVPAEAAYLRATNITKQNNRRKTQRSVPDSHRHRA